MQKKYKWCKRLKIFRNIAKHWFSNITLKKLIRSYNQTAYRLRTLEKLFSMNQIVKLTYFNYLSPNLWMLKKSIINKYEGEKQLRLFLDLFGSLPYFGVKDCYE